MIVILVKLTLLVITHIYENAKIHIYVTVIILSLLLLHMVMWCNTQKSAWETKQM